MWIKPARGEVVRKRSQRVAGGDLNFTIEKDSDDELGLLVDSFNSMTADLLASNSQLAEAHHALQESNQISEQRRRYLEAVLRNVAAGVIAINEQHQVTIINPFAEKLLRIDPADFLQRDFHEVLPLSHAAVLEQFQSFVRRVNIVRRGRQNRRPTIRGCS